MKTLPYSMTRGLLRAALATGTILSAAAIVSAPVFAQTPQAAEAEGAGDDIVVTAQMREQNLQDLPLAITAVSGAQLEARSQTRLTDIAAQAPNVILQQNPAGSGNSMRAFIRGVGQSDQSPSVEPGVGIYVDDIYFGTVTASAFDLTDLDRVEVLLGPQGTLAGMNSEGGAIKLYSKKPEGKGGYVEASFGTFNRRDIKASADFTVVPDALYARITGVSRNRDGYVTRYDYACLNPTDPEVISQKIPRLAAVGKDCKTGELGNQKMFAMRGSLRFAPTGSPLEINISADYTKDTSETQATTLIASRESAGKGTASVPPFSQPSLTWQGVAFDDRFVPYGPYRRSTAVLNDPYASYASFYDPGVMYTAASLQLGPPNSITPGKPLGPFIAPSAAQVDGWGVSGTIDYELSPNLALKSITGYRKYFSQSGSDNDNSPVMMIQDNSKFFHHQFSEELRLSGKLLDDTVHFTLGAFYYDAATRYDARIHTAFSGFCPDATPCFSFINDDTASLTSYAGFANVSWDVTDRLSLEGGIRVTHEQKDYAYSRLNPDGQGIYLPLVSLNNLTGTYKETLTDFRAAASYKIDDSKLIYAQFATGFKGGGNAPRPYNDLQVRPFGAEKLRSYEIGFKTDFFDRRLRLNGDVFYMEYKGYQGTPNICLDKNDQQLPPATRGPFCGQYLNIGDAHVKGFELEATIKPVDGLTIDGSLSLTDFKFVSITYPTTAIRVGSTRPGIGDWKWSAGIQYQAILGDIGTLTPRIDVAYTPGYCGDFDCFINARIEPHTVTNARITYETADKDWMVSLEATNLFDKFYYLNKFVNAWYVDGQPGRPREVALTVKRRF